MINGDRYFDLYSFDGVANQVVSLSLTRVSGSLDTLLLVLDPSGSIIADSDDIVAGNVTGLGHQQSAAAASGRRAVHHRRDALR
ncbi:MAG: hypothetical protein HND48_11795 [Chloroflexi bacterium]|nr:hypothetical protein [Chloroflexota bacterium]